jgi:hypothetical protein
VNSSINTFPFFSKLPGQRFMRPVSSFPNGNNRWALGMAGRSSRSEPQWRSKWLLEPASVPQERSKWQLECARSRNGVRNHRGIRNGCPNPPRSCEGAPSGCSNLHGSRSGIQKSRSKFLFGKAASVRFFFEPLCSPQLCLVHGYARVRANVYIFSFNSTRRRPSHHECWGADWKNMQTRKTCKQGPPTYSKTGAHARKICEQRRLHKQGRHTNSDAPAYDNVGKSDTSSCHNAGHKPEKRANHETFWFNKDGAQATKTCEQGPQPVARQGRKPETHANSDAHKQGRHTNSDAPRLAHRERNIDTL